MNCVGNMLCGSFASCWLEWDFMTTRNSGPNWVEFSRDVKQFLVENVCTRLEGLYWKLERYILSLLSDTMTNVTGVGG